MKKSFWIVAGIVLAAVVLGVLGTGVARAQGGQPPIMGGMMQGGYGWMHDYVEQALAARLGLTEQQVEEQLAAGTSMYQIALDKGIKQEELATFMNEVHKEAFDKAVAAGVIPQERADWMLQRMQNMFQNGTGPGNCPMHNGQGTPLQRGRGMMGRGWGAQTP